jgi:predicted SpoU family rRNA methylase
MSAYGQCNGWQGKFLLSDFFFQINSLKVSIIQLLTSDKVDLLIYQLREYDIHRGQPISEVNN